MNNKLLLHSCCAVCSSHVISVLAQEYDLSVFYYNPNIWPREEYEHRKSEQIRLINTAPFCSNVKYFDEEYDHSEYLACVNGLEKEPEGGLRCTECFRMRLERTAQFAKENNFDLFCTTLTVSPHKNSEIINAIGEEKQSGSSSSKNEKKELQASKCQVALSNELGCKDTCLFADLFSPEVKEIIVKIKNEQGMEWVETEVKPKLEKLWREIDEVLVAAQIMLDFKNNGD